MKKFKLFLVLGIMLGLLSACGSAESKLVGQWEDADGSKISEIEFFCDCTYTTNHPNYISRYSVHGDRIKLAGLLVEDLTYDIKVNSNILKFYDTGEVEYEYTKK